MAIGAMNMAANAAAQHVQTKTPREAPPPNVAENKQQSAATNTGMRANEARANEQRVNETRASEAPPKPVVNAQGQTTGRIINTSA